MSDDEDPTAPQRGPRSRHPTDAELASYADGSGVSVELYEHLVECKRCRAFVASRAVGAPADGGSLIGGRYRIEHLLATGGIGAVVRAVDQKLGNHVAIKLMLPHAAEDANVRSRFALEARLAVRMRSEHVARVLDVGDGDAPYIVYEYLVGEDLTAMLRRRGALPVDEACEHVLQACEAMAEAHSLGIIHRDLKPANLFVTTRPDGGSCIKVIDFGIAKTTNFARDGGVPDLTLNKLVGTPRYMSPEQIKSSADVDERTDVWGLGAILYELVTGECPYEAPSVNEVFAKILHDVPPPPSAVRGELPKPLDPVIMRCLAHDPARRYGTVADLARALVPFAPARAAISAERAERALRLVGGRAPWGRERGRGSARARRRAETMAGQPPAAALPPPPRAPRQRNPIPFAIAGAAVLAIAIVVGWRVIAGGGGRSVPLGTPCTSDAACGALACLDGTCTRACTRAVDCPAPARCTSDGTCNLPLKVGFVYVGVPEDEGWTRTHDLGRRHAAAKLPYVETDYVSNAYRPEDAERAIDDLVGRGFGVIVANSSSLASPLRKKAVQYPAVTFIAVMAYAPGPGVGAINARMYEAWYLAGTAAARRSKSHRLGYVGALVTPEVVRDINAFTRGARSVDPAVVVEVRWLGFWFDAGKPDAQGHYKEERLALELIATGCDVIANHADNTRVIAAVEQAHAGAVSIANNNIDACARGPTTCLGAAYWNWGPLYVEQLAAIHRGTWRSATAPWEELRANPDASVVGFKLAPQVAGANLALETAATLAELAKPGGAARVFEGPFCSTGQRRSCVAAGETVADDELRAMCWFVDGVVERAGTAADRPALVPPECAGR